MGWAFLIGAMHSISLSRGGFLSGAHPNPCCERFQEGWQALTPSPKRTTISPPDSHHPASGSIGSDRDGACWRPVYKIPARARATYKAIVSAVYSVPSMPSMNNEHR